MTTRLSAEELSKFLANVFPQATEYDILEVSEHFASVRLPVDERHLRPGGTVSGPSIFGLVDVSFYVAVLAMIGPEALTVTTNCTIDFMRKPVADRDLVARANIHKLGRVLAVGQVLVYSDGDDRPVAQASVTYSIPPAR